MFCCCEPLGPGYGNESDKPGRPVSTFPGDRRFTKTGGNALSAAPQQGTPYQSSSQSGATAPQYGTPQTQTGGAPQHQHPQYNNVPQQATDAPQYGAQAPLTSSNAEKVVAGTLHHITSNLL
jgi:hypothetical protein